MSLRAIVSGALYRAPHLKTARSGRPYATATIREGSGETVRWVKAFAFSESACDDLMKLCDGDPVSVAGEIDAEIYKPDSGEARVSWKITADAVLSARAKPREKKEKSKPEGSAASSQHRGVGGDQDDDIPF